MNVWLPAAQVDINLNTPLPKQHCYFLSIAKGSLFAGIQKSLRRTLLTGLFIKDVSEIVEGHINCL